MTLKVPLFTPSSTVRRLERIPFAPGAACASSGSRLVIAPECFAMLAEGLSHRFEEAFYG
jgi:hypothetical protein